MSEDFTIKEVAETSTVTLTDSKPLFSGKNRKQRRMEKAWERKEPKGQTPNAHHWCNRIVREMIQNKDIQQKIIDGDFDYFLENLE